MLNTQTNDYRGINDWNTATLMKELNGDYLDTTLTANKNWYNGRNNQQTGTFNYTTVIKEKYQNMISNSVWNIGGNSYTGSAPYTLNLLTQYNRERDKITYQNSRPTTWTGKVGLIYASDYGYASTLAECHENLRAGVTYENDKWDFSNGLCKTDNWLAKSSWYWTLSPYSGHSNGVFCAGGDGAVSNDRAYNSYGVFPAVFLKSDVLITGGTGTAGDPYQIRTMSDFANDSWSIIAENVKNGNSSIYKIGDEKEVEIGGNSYTVRVANNSTPSECKGASFSQTACGFVVEFVDIVETRAMNSSNTNVGGWPATAMRTYANGDFFNKLPSDLKKVIVDTTVISGHGTTSGETNFTSTDKIYLLSAKEVMLDGSSIQISGIDTAYNNTRQLDYYSSKGVTTTNYADAIKQINGSNGDWWFRSTGNSNFTFLYLFMNGGWYNFDANRGIGFAPAFRIG